LGDCRQDTDFLPVALILGLVPGVPLEVPIVVVAEDGVTSLRYYVNVIRAPGPATANISLVDDSGSGAAGLVLGSGDADEAEALGLPQKVMTQRRSAALVPPPYRAGMLPPGATLEWSRMVPSSPLLTRSLCFKRESNSRLFSNVSRK
jgi:hypothetical protein